jgi:PAS domain S-box-containing protein
VGRSYSGLIVTSDRISPAAFNRGEPLPRTRVVVQKADGGQAVLEVALSEQIIHDHHVGYLGLARDITEREQAAAKLLRSERMLAEAQEVGHIGSWELDFETSRIWWSAEQYRLFGQSPEGPAPSWHEFLSCIAEPSRAQFDRDMAMVLELGQHQWDVTIIDANGVQKILQSRGRVVRDEHGAALRLIGTAADVTEARRAAELLRTSEERFRLLAAATNDAVWDADLITDLVWRGDSSQAIFGDSPDKYPDAKSFVAQIHPDDRNAVLASLEKAIGSREMSWSSEYRFRRADGTWLTLLDRAYIVRDDSGRAVRMLGAMMDLTARKQLESQLEQAHRVSGLGRVAASVAHEFNNVLMGIQPNVEILRRLDSGAPPHVTDNILRAVQRGRCVTEQILRFTRRTEPDLRTVDVKAFIEGWFEDVRPLLGPMSLSIAVADDALSMSADPLQLAQVLTNLAINSRDALADGGKATLAVTTATTSSRLRFGLTAWPDSYLQFTMTDEGCGIAEDLLSHIFEPLFTTKSSGNGLGLAICHQIVKQHGGHIFVESEPGRGTTFHLFIRAALSTAEAVPVIAPADSRAMRVLLVEDEPAVAQGLQMLLELDGWSVNVASLGSEAVPAITELVPDAVVLDISLPDMDGMDVYRAIESRWPDLPVLFSSGHADSTQMDDLLARPHVGFIAKPYAIEEIQAALARITGGGTIAPAAMAASA